VAHDFNNILVVIKLSTEMMLGQITPDSPPSRPLLQVSKAADRAASLTKQLLAFSRRQTMQAGVVNINSVVSDTLRMLRRIIGEDIQLVTRLADGLANTRLDPDQLGQVVLNLAVNCAGRHAGRRNAPDRDRQR
jgi:signal transduction histidine kinase